MPAARAARVLAVALSLLAAALPAAARAVPSARELVPAYFAPEGSPNPWQSMCVPAAAGSIAIMNPDNGPVRRQAALYAPAIAACQDAGWRVIGYVYTRYGKRRLATVEKAIDDYYSWYPGIAGIFLDEMAGAPSAKLDDYYAALAQLVHGRGGVVVGNPGDSAATGWQLEYLDTVVTFEGSASQYASYAPDEWERGANPAQIANIIYAASESSTMGAICAEAMAEGTGFVYVTDLARRPNPYAALPSYYSGELEDC